MKRVKVFNGASNTLLISDSLEQYLQEDVLCVEVTTDKPRTIILPEYSTLVNISLQINILDVTGNAKNNPITIQTQGGDKINGAASIQINTNSGFCQVTGGTRNIVAQWIGAFGGAATSSAGGGGGGGGGSSFQTFDFTLQAADALALLNAPASSVVILPPAVLNTFYQLISCSAYAASAFDGNAPALTVGTVVGALNAILTTPDDYLAAPFNEPCQLRPVLTPHGKSIAAQGSTLVVCAATNSGSTVGGNVRFWGVYLVRSLLP